MRNPITQTRARALRNHATDTERYLWRHLRDRQLGGHRFRRQVPIGAYIADFACLEAKLIIELDGGQHQEQAEYDARRGRQIEAEGFRVLRFWDNQVFQETPAVLEVILRALEGKACPHPSPPPRCAQGRELQLLPPPAGEGWDGGKLPPPLVSPWSLRNSGNPAGLPLAGAGEGGGGGDPEGSANIHHNSETAEQVHNAP